MVRVFHHYISSVFLVLFTVEFCTFFAAMYFGSELRFLSSDSWYSENYIVLASILFASILSLCLAGIGLYRRSLGLSEYELMSRTAVSFAAATAILVTIYFIFPEFLIARSVLAYALTLSLLGLMLSRYAFKRLAGKSVFQKNILVIGTGKNAKKILQSNTEYIHKGFDIVGCFITKDENNIVDEKLIINNNNESIKEIALLYSVNEIVVAVDDRRSAMPVDDLLDCKISGIEIVDLLSFYERENACIKLENLYPSWLVFSDGFAKSGLRTIIKRTVDISASFVLLVITLPIMLLTAIAILLESGLKAPILYRQVRVGENNQDFNVLKFRSMRTDAEKKGVQFAQENDDRITKVGRFTRACRIDELPQIFNVFKGDMSFVGPRPERPMFVQDFEKAIPYYRERHRVKPGITGWAQLCYPYGANEYDARQKLQYDLYYVKNYSLFLDLTIILHTVEIILWGKGVR